MACDMGRDVTRTLPGGNECVTAANCRSMVHTGSTRGAVSSGDCIAASGANCNADGGRAFNFADTGCVVSCIADDGGRGRDSGHNCVVADASSCRLAAGNSDTMGFNNAGTCVQTASECTSGRFAEGGSSGNNCVTDCSNAAQGVNSNNLCVATSTAGDCIRAERLLQGSACTEACGGGTPYYDGTDTCVAASGCLTANQGVSTAAASRFGREIAPNGMCAAPSAGTCYNAGNSTHFFQGSSCVTSCAPGTPLMRSANMMNSCVTAVACRGSLGGAVSGTDSCVAASGVNCNADGARAFNNAMTGCVASCIANDGGRGRNSAHECVAASGSSCRLAAGNSDTMGFNNNGTCVQTASECTSGRFAEGGGGGNNCVTDCSNAAQGVNSSNLCVATSTAGDCIRAQRLLQGGACTETCGGGTPLYDGTNTCVAASACLTANQGVSTAAVTRFGREIAADGMCAAASAGTCYNAGTTTRFFQGSSCVDDVCVGDSIEAFCGHDECVCNGGYVS